MRAGRKLRRVAVEHSATRGLAILINDIMPSMIATMRRMHDIQKLQNERMHKMIQDAEPSDL